MKKSILLAVILLLTASNLFPQKQKDAIYLTNGSIIYGQLIEADNQNYRIKTYDGSIFVFPAADVSKFIKGEKYSAFFSGRKEKGFTFSLEGGFLIGPGSSDPAAPFSFNFLTGATLKTKHLVSFGSGVEFIERPFTPLFVEYKYIYADQKTSPFFFFRTGGVVPVGGNSDDHTPDYYNYGPKHYRGGLSVGIGTGISWAKEDHESYLSFAYRYASTRYRQYQGNLGTVNYTNNLNRLEIKLGFKF